MPAWAVLSAYGLAACAAIGLLYRFHAQAWYLHAMSLTAALAVGLTPTPESWAKPGLDLLAGALFTFLCLWGAAAPFFRETGHRGARHA